MALEADERGRETSFLDGLSIARRENIVHVGDVMDSWRFWTLDVHVRKVRSS